MQPPRPRPGLIRIPSAPPTAHRVRLLALAPLLALAAATSACPAPSTAPRGEWTSAPALAHPRAAHAVVATDDALYALAGVGPDGAPVLAVERFDGARWTDDAALPGAGLNAPAAVAVDGRVFVLGGFDTTTNIPTDRVLVYDPSARSWAEAAPLPAPRGGHAAALVDGRIHVVGGGNQRTTLADHDVYDPASDAWSPRAPLPRAEGSPAAIVHAGVLHVIGGRSGTADFGAVDRYDPASDTWSAGPPIEPRGTAGAAVICGEIHVFGGESQSRHTALDEVLRLDPARGWQPAAPLPTARTFARAVVLGGDVYVVGGGLAPQTSHAPPGVGVVERMRVSCP